MEEVSFARLERVEAVAAEDLVDDQRARDDHRSALGLQAGELAALREWEGGKALELPVDRLARDPVAVDPFGVVLAELERCEGRDGAGDADRVPWAPVR